MHMFGFLHSFIFSPVRFRFYQKYSDMQWAIDNFYLGPGCLENCRGHGDCLNEQCICDPGYSGPNCYLTQTLKVILLHVLNNEFWHVFVWEGERGQTDLTGNLALIPVSLKTVKSIFSPFIIFSNKTTTALFKNGFVALKITFSLKKL